METNVEVGFHVNHRNDDDVLIRHSENVEPTLDYCASMRGVTQRSKFMRKVASLPNVVYYDWLRKGIIQDKTRFRRALEEYKKLKCVNDRLWIPTRVQKRIYTESGHIK